MIALSSLRSDFVAAPNVELICITPALLKNMLETHLFARKYSIFLDQQINLAPLFQMRYGSFLTSEK